MDRLYLDNVPLLLHVLKNFHPLFEKVQVWLLKLGDSVLTCARETRQQYAPSPVVEEALVVVRPCQGAELHKLQLVRQLRRLPSRTDGHHLNPCPITPPR